MLHTLTGTVIGITEDRPGLMKLRVAPAEDPNAVRRALAYTDLVGRVSDGDRVLLNITAVELSLGTGGWDFVIANLTRAENEPRSTLGEETPGHLIKLRYAPQQVAVQAAEEAYPDLPESLEGRPVLIAELHSQIVPALIGLKTASETLGIPYPRVAYLMPDTAALPLALSETIPQLQERGMIHATITCGQAFGGDYEAVTLGSGMAVAVSPARCDVLLVAQGPGNAGTGSLLGFGGLVGAEAAHLAAALGGDPILVPRVSESDSRPRHRGLSHHTKTLVERLLLVPVTLPVPEETEGPVLHETNSPAPSSMRGTEGSLPYGLVSAVGHRVERAPAGALRSALRSSDLPLRSMGRSLEDDPAFFLAATAAGWVAGLRYSRTHPKGSSL